MCNMSNVGYDDVKELITNVMGLNDWLLDKEPVEPSEDQLGGMNFTINWQGDGKTRYWIRLNNNVTYDMQIFQYQSYRQVGLAIEKGLPRESILMIFSTTYQEIVSQTNEIISDLRFELSPETKEILKNDT